MVRGASLAGKGRMKRNKIISAGDAARVVMDGDPVATSGFVGIGFPEELAIGHERRKSLRVRDL